MLAGPALGEGGPCTPTSSPTSPCTSSTDCPAVFLADLEAAPRLLRPAVHRHTGGRALASSSQARCPLCSSKQASFHCSSCVTSGDFVHSSTRLFERFSEKALRLFALRREVGESKEQVEEAAGEGWRRRRLKEDTKAARTNVKYYKHLIAKALDRRTANLQMLNKVRASNQRREARLPKFEDKAERMAACADTFVQDLSTARARLAAARRRLREVQRGFVLGLQDIFPLSQVLPAAPTSTPDLMLDCLADAMRTSYLHGRWVTGDQSGEAQYRIVAPLLSSSGDYTPVYSWVAANKPSGGAGTSDLALALPAHTIAAGLALTCQLSSLAAGVLGQLLPARIHYQDLGVLETSEYRFARKVAKLNTNVVVLVLALGLPPGQVSRRALVHLLFIRLL